MDSLRYWVTEMHVDGFRFDLAATLAREFYEVDKLSAFFDLVQQDPIVSQVKLIAEPWDLGPGGYQVGNFPPVWTEWNGKYRDTVRDFWRGEPATLGELASRLTGSSDLYENTGRRPVASINFVTAHDGFTLRDLVSYNGKHNDANGEDGKDGTDDNRSWNCGAEGDTDDPAIIALRGRQQRNFLATLLLSEGVPMILHGDELGRTQHGNNNGYAQDSELTWVHWDEADQELIEFTSAIARLRRDHPTFRRSRFFDGRPVKRGEGEPLPDVEWLKPDSTAMSPEDWDAGFGRTLGMYLNGQGIHGVDAHGERLADVGFLVYYSAHDEPVPLVLPDADHGAGWDVIVDTAGDRVNGSSLAAGAACSIGAHTLLVLQEQLIPRDSQVNPLVPLAQFVMKWRSTPKQGHSGRSGGIMNRTAEAVGTSTAIRLSASTSTGPGIEDIADPREAPAISVTEAVVGIHRVALGTATIGYVQFTGDRYVSLMGCVYNTSVEVAQALTLDAAVRRLLLA